MPKMEAGTSFMDDPFGMRMLEHKHVIRGIEDLLKEDDPEEYTKSVRQEFDENGCEVELDELDKILLKRNKPQIHKNEKKTPLLNEIAADLSELGDNLIEILREREKKKQMSKSVCRRVNDEQSCAFCKNNNETKSVYTSHTLKDENDEVVCPVLFKYVCPICSATGKQAHTIRYCPNNISDVLPITAITKSFRSAAGIRKKSK